GAFMKSEEHSRRLAESLVAIGNRSGVRTEAIITRMDTPLGNAVGNALEVVECLDVLKGRSSGDLVDLSVELAARMLVLGGVAGTGADAERRVRDAIQTGAGLERFRQIIETQGGDPRVVDQYDRLPSAPNQHVMKASRDGYVSALDAELVGRAAVALGAGRDRVEDNVDPAVGILVLAPVGSEVRAGDGILELHYRDERRLSPATSLAARAIAVGDTAPPAMPFL